MAYRFETTMELGDTSDEEASPERPKKRELSKSTRIQMVTMLQTLETDDGMRSGSFAMVAECFGVARSTVYRLWNRVVRTRAHGHIISPEFQSHKKNCGRPPMYPSEFVREGIKNIPLRKRRTQRKLAASLGVSKTTVQRWIVDSTIRVHCNSLKPVLTEENKVARLIMALESRDPNDPSKFHDTTNKPNERKRKRNEREHHAHPQPIIKLNEYPPYPHASGRVGATANARQHRSSVCFFV